MANDGGGHQVATQREIELMRQQLLPSMSKDIEAVLKLLNESAGEDSRSIFRVPQALAGGIAEASLPRIVSIGPYHHGESLQMFQVDKWRYLHTMLERTQPHGIHLENLIDVVAPKEKIIRQCYSESIENFNGPDLVKMMVLDGCFIIEFLRQIAGYVPPDRILLINSNSFVLLSLGRNLLRLENQIPYFVLEDLFEMTSVSGRTSSLDNLAFRFFSCFLEGPAIVGERPKGVHLLDLFRLSLIPTNQQDNPVDESSSYHMIKSASEFCRLGIGFKRSEASTFLEIIFDSRRRTIGIPKIKIDHDLNCILPNMVAYENSYSFIIEFIRQISRPEQFDDILSNNSYMYISVVQDLSRLENQVPYFVLEDLFETTNVSKEKTSLTILAVSFFDGIMERSDRFSERDRNFKVVHLLDLLR
ncbi:UPF0481 protein At3g47200-like [Eucalyptus grandis]|uniref:UPF0481 protein At3g47200-like n=1 Tax=Eucalyptus grandis TaxID=71139 RepID=UPI00192ED08F|nr:UPF0481 protein At3g47200-like [Eucalyptus grandis]